MAKRYYITILLKFSFLICLAQPVPVPPPSNPILGGSTPRSVVPSPRREAAPLTVILQANHSFYLKVDGKDYGKIEKGQKKQVPLRPGVRKFTFEEADSTGERIVQYFKVTRERLRQNDTLFAINFKGDFLEIIQSKQSSAPGINSSKQR